MNKKIIFIILLLFVFIMGCTNIYEDNNIDDNDEIINVVDNDLDSDNSPTVIDSPHIFNVRYSDGKLYYNATIQKPTPCHILEVKENIVEKDPIKVSININILPVDMVCTEVISYEFIEHELELDSKPKSISFYVNTKLVANFDTLEEILPISESLSNPNEQLLGSTCATVSPDSRDECCQRKYNGTELIRCMGAWKFNQETFECQYMCGELP